jgi:hypothetical protein
MRKTLVDDDTSSATAAGDRRSFLTPPQVAMIDEALSSLGEYGELRLVVEKGRLRFVVTHKSFDVSKWTPGTIQSQSR